MRSLLVAAVAGLVLSAAAATALAQPQSYPSRAITLISPFPPGGSTDVVARVMAERMRPFLGQSVVVENVGGAGGSIGVGRVARAAPDGYTIDLGQWDTHVGNGAVYNLAYDLRKDFEPIGLLTFNPLLLLARKTIPAQNMKDLVAWLRGNVGNVTLANQTAAAQVAGVLLQQATDTKVMFVPYRGGGPAMQDLVAGRIDLLVIQAAAGMPQVNAGTIKAFANLSPSRSFAVPGIPTADEGGVPGLHVAGWFGFFAPRDTPKEAIQRLNAAMVQALADPAVQTRLAQLGLDIAPRELQTPAGLAAFHKAEIDKWWPIIKAAGIKAE
ncbi:MAG TPA: tripartite tricarboxylate transporter substrate-binding protein [Burkholderiales bacterium]